MSSIFDILNEDAGEFSPRYRQRKLSQDEAATIRLLYSGSDVTQRQLAEEYGVSQPQISKIVNEKQWKGER